jgi:adenine-specific DNA-methyltransferase
MATTQDVRQKFATLLREMFQLDQPELDFGIYRIMHARKDDINRFIEQDLPKNIQQAFEGFQGQDKQQVVVDLEKAKQAAIAAGFDPSQSPKVQELEAHYNANLDLSREEGDVYDALLTFFNRYYDEGDFISRRIYKEGTYAIPYNGEEVVLHWANKDQYYIKSSENLRDYAFRVNPHDDENPMRVHFKLVDAQPGPSNSNKETEGANRVFVLRNGDGNDQAWSEVKVKNGDAEATELEIYFEYRVATDSDWTVEAKSSATPAAQKKAPTQDHLRQMAVQSLIGQSSDLPEQWKTPLAKNYIKADSEAADYSLLQGQINNYTKANKFDYFIHKDLGKFLRQELDFYIKNELLRWEDIAANKSNFAKLAPLFSKIEVIRQLGESIITFLAQLEDFQKKLWLKKKFVTETNYCITLDRLENQPGLVKIALENEAQKQEWVRLFNIDLTDLDQVKEQGVEEVLSQEKHRYLVLDTQWFDEAFKAELLGGIDELDEQMNGLLIHSENFQALNLMQEKYKEQIKCVHVDPPYNTATSGFLYKNTYQHSSWMSMMFDRVGYSNRLLNDEGAFVCHIDENEYENLHQLCNYQGLNNPGTVIWDKRNPMTGGGGLATQHEYIIWRTKNNKAINQRNKGIISMLTKVSELINKAAGVISDDVRKKYSDWINSNKNLSGGEKAYKFIDDSGRVYQSVSLRAPEPRSDQKFHKPLIHPTTDKPCAMPPNGFSRTPETLSRMVVRGDILFGKDETTQPRQKLYLTEDTSRQLTTMLQDAKKGKAYTDALGLIFPYCHPVSLYDELISSVTHEKSGYVLDYFAGSGTTGHSVINLNREDDGNRKYILCEMGAYFDTVTKPRIQKVIYSKDWKDGNPQTDSYGRLNGVSQCFKYIRLESYEDTLGNLALNRPAEVQQQLFNSNNPDVDESRQAYLMNYLLEVETRGSDSLLNTSQFTNPMAYQLKVRSASGDETKIVNVDLLETFNWLLGLQVEHIAAPVYFDATFNQTDLGRWQADVKRLEKGAQNEQAWWFRTVVGKNRKGQSILIVWRNLPSVIAGEENSLIKDNAVLEAVLLEKLKVRLTESPDDEFDILYVNGDHNITIPKRKDGELMQARVQSVEETFHRLMFATEDGLMGA